MAKGRVQVRYEIWARAQLTEQGARWQYCTNEPQTQVTSLTADLTLLHDGDSGTSGCTVVEKALPQPTRLTAKYGAYELGELWLWRIESAWPMSVAASDAHQRPFVFVIDTSKSQRQGAGVAAQLRVVKALLAGLSHEPVELVLVNRRAVRVLGHFVPASELDAAWVDRLAQVPLANGSFLEKGVELAVDALTAIGRGGEIVVLGDQELRSRFEPAHTVARLRQAPPGTKVHLVEPVAHATNDVVVEPSAYLPATSGVNALVASRGGSKLRVFVGPQEAHSPASLEQLMSGALLGTAVKPRAFRVSLRDRALPFAGEWPSRTGLWQAYGRLATGSFRLSFEESLLQSSALETPTGSEALAGARKAWMGYSRARPPDRLRLSGQAEGRLIEVDLARDPEFDAQLVRLANSQLDVLRCLPENQHARRALASGFLAPGLEFWVSGADSTEGVSGTTYGHYTCGGTEGTVGRGLDMPPANSAVTDMPAVLRSCTNDAPVRGPVAIWVESRSSEILDVGITHSDPALRHCVEEALWAIDLPLDFNDGQPATFTWQSP
jgi:hypothetical protein